MEIPFQDVDIYGYRPCHMSLFYLSPWEFFTYWMAEEVPMPNMNTTDGMSLWFSEQEMESRKTKANITSMPEDVKLPGIHYGVNEEFFTRHPRYMMFPDVEILHFFRHQWVLKRRERPVCPCPEHTPLPRNGMAADQKARILSVYLRPWTLLQEFDNAAVPHLRNLRRIVDIDKDLAWQRDGHSWREASSLANTQFHS